MPAPLSGSGRTAPPQGAAAVWSSAGPLLRVPSCACLLLLADGIVSRFGRCVGCVDLVLERVDQAHDTRILFAQMAEHEVEDLRQTVAQHGHEYVEDTMRGDTHAASWEEHARFGAAWQQPLR